VPRLLDRLRSARIRVEARMLRKGIFVNWIESFMVILIGFASLFWGVTAPAFSGSEGLIHLGDRVEVALTCRIPSGELAASTSLSEGGEAVAKASVFTPRSTSEPLVIAAGPGAGAPPAGRERSFEEEILERIGAEIVGKPSGQPMRLRLLAGRQPERGEADYVLAMARIRKRPAQARVTVDAYRSRMGKAPAVGDTYTTDPALPGRVTSVQGDEVLIAFSPQDGPRVSTPLGEAEVRNVDDGYELHIDARPGQLVRTGHLVGRIIQVTADQILIDYRDPFGGETLECEVVARKSASR
jgi:hypothetical protein